MKMKYLKIAGKFLVVILALVLVLLAALAIFVGSFFLVPRIGVEFVPAADLGESVVDVETPVGDHGGGRGKDLRVTALSHFGSARHAPMIGTFARETAGIR